MQDGIEVSELIARNKVKAEYELSTPVYAQKQTWKNWAPHADRARLGVLNIWGANKNSCKKEKKKFSQIAKATKKWLWIPNTTVNTNVLILFW